MKKGFTLIELLIVVAIIAILAAIAVPNFLEAQVRAKVSRALADMRSVNTAFETYRIDHNKLPPHGTYHRTANGQGLIAISRYLYTLDPVLITTPISYLNSEAATLDVFQADQYKGDSVVKSNPNEWALGRLNYTNFDQGDPPVSAGAKTLGFERFGGWRLIGAGPDKATFNAQLPPEGTATSRIAASKMVPYDASNGTVSVGDIVRTAKGDLQRSYL